MDKKLARARDLLPSIIITVLSMIQALALELFWSRIQASDYLWDFDAVALIGWLQVLVVLLGIVQIWIMYVSLMLRFTWLPSMWDTIIPFVIGLLEFGMIDLMGPGKLGLWFLAFAAIFSVSVVTAHLTHRRARQDPENDYFFNNVAPARWRDYSGSILSIGGFAVMGLILLWTGFQFGIALLGLTLATVALVFQLTLTRRYWMHTLME